MAEAERWKVTGVVPMTATTEDDRIVNVYQVTFTTAGGTRGYVEVPRSGYTPEKAAALVEAEASKLIATESLRG